MIRFGWCCCFYLWFAFVCECFVLKPHNAARISGTATSATTISTSSNIISNNNDKQSFLVVLDSDCILDTIEHRSKLGIKTALCAWPKLKDEQVLQESDQSWLSTKLSALSHVLSDESSSELSTTCEFALATRLVLEEQALDEGESNGKRGKYASKYHPRSNSTDTGTKQQTSSSPPSSSSSSSSSTRPLTVGEISANWHESLRETLLMRYHCNYKDPMPILQSYIEQHYDDDDDDDDDDTKIHLPNVYRDMVHSVSCRKMIVTVTPSDLQMVQRSLEFANIQYHATSSPSQAVDYFYRCDNNERGTSESIILLLTQETKLKTMEQVLKMCSKKEKEEDNDTNNNNNNNNVDDDMTVVVVDSSWKRLESLVALFGDNIPREDYNTGKSFVPGIRLSLNLPDWTAQQQNPTNVAQATMNPWTGILSWDTIVNEFLSVQQEDAFQ